MKEYRENLRKAYITYVQAKESLLKIDTELQDALWKLFDANDHNENGVVSIHEFISKCDPDISLAELQMNVRKFQRCDADQSDTITFTELLNSNYDACGISLHAISNLK